MFNHFRTIYVPTLLWIPWFLTSEVDDRQNTCRGGSVGHCVTGLCFPPVVAVLVHVWMATGVVVSQTKNVPCTLCYTGMHGTTRGHFVVPLLRFTLLPRPFRLWKGRRNSGYRFIEDPVLVLLWFITNSCYLLFTCLWLKSLPLPPSHFLNSSHSSPVPLRTSLTSPLELFLHILY